MFSLFRCVFHFSPPRFIGGSTAPSCDERLLTHFSPPCTAVHSGPRTLATSRTRITCGDCRFIDTVNFSGFSDIPPPISTMLRRERRRSLYDATVWLKSVRRASYCLTNALCLSTSALYASTIPAFVLSIGRFSKMSDLSIRSFSASRASFVASTRIIHASAE